ncbi:Endothelin-converting enzyme 2, partial [Ceratocystis fimbriata CBS 114723]
MVCGGWRRKHRLRSDEEVINTTKLIQRHVDKIIHDIVEGPLPTGIDPNSQDAKNFYKMKAVYNSCMDSEAIKSRGIEPLKEVLALIDGAETTKDALLILLKHDTDGLAVVGPQIDDTSPDYTAIGFAGPKNLGLPLQSDFESKSTIKKYYFVVKKILTTLYPETTPETIMHLVKLEKTIAMLLPSEGENYSTTDGYGSMSLEEAAKLVPELGLQDIVSTLAPEGVSVDRVIVHDKNYFNALHKLLEKASPDVLKSYFRWHLIVSYRTFIDSDILKPLNDFYDSMLVEDDRKTQCIHYTESSVRNIVSRFLVERAFSPAAKTMTEEMVANLKEVYTERLKAAEWMDSDSADLAIKKLYNMRQKIGYSTSSPNITNPDELADAYRYSVINDNTHFENEVSLRQMKYKLQWEYLGKPLDRDIWQNNPNVANAYYQGPGNEIILPAGLMQFPIFDVEAPAYVSYGGYGSAVGHEMSHAFDSERRYYDENGVHTETLRWWTPDTNAAFNTKAQCFVDQYSNLVHRKKGKFKTFVDGKITLNENIADAGGLLASYQAWKKLDAADKGGEMLPGLEFFNREQLFFVSYVNRLCSKYNLPSGHIFNDSHSPDWARAAGTLANSEDFLRAFNCPVKEPTCKMW